MGILKTLLEEMKPNINTSILEKIRTLCDQIFEQEKKNIKHLSILPSGPNIFLTLEVPGRIKGEIAFLSLERESEDLYLAVLFVTNEKEFAEYTKKQHSNLSIKRQRVWEISDHRPGQILTQYAKRYKFLRGE